MEVGSAMAGSVAACVAGSSIPEDAGEDVISGAAAVSAGLGVATAGTSGVSAEASKAGFGVEGGVSRIDLGISNGEPIHGENGGLENVPAVLGVVVAL
jgi:hypothetical protein